MKAEQPWFPRDCDEAVAASKQFRRACVKTTERSGNAPWLNQPRNDKARAIPVFGSFPGPPADSGVSFHTGSADVSSKKSPSSRALEFFQIVSSTQSLSISSNSNLSPPFSQPQHCRTEPEHGPLSMACAQASATGSHQQSFYATHPAQHKLQQNNRDNNVQDISGCDKQSAARSRLQTTTSSNRNQNSFVPALSASLPNLPTQTQRNTWLDQSDRTVGSGALQQRAPQNIELNSPRPHEVSPPRWESSPSTRTPQPGSSRFGGPRRKPSTMCQTYYKRHPSWCARPTQLCSPIVPSPSSSQFSQKPTPSTTPLSSLSSLGTPASSIKSLSSTHSKYKQGPSAHFEMCAPERTWDDMYYHPQHQEYLDAVAVAGLTSPEEIYTPAVPMRATQQHHMRPLPPPRRPREEIYSMPGLYTPTLEDFESVSESIAAVLAPHSDMGVDHVEYADQNAPFPVRDDLQTAQNDIIDEDDHAWNDIMSDFPRSVEECPPNQNPASRDMYLPSEIHAAVVASAGGSVASDTGGGGVTADQDVCTLANRCRLCAGLSYFERLDVHPELGQQHRLPNPTLWQSDSENEPQNGMLAHLASESEPVGWEYTGSSRGPSVWGAVGEPVPMRLRRYDVQELPGVSGMRT